MAEDPGEVCERDGSNKGRWTEWQEDDSSNGGSGHSRSDGKFLSREQETPAAAAKGTAGDQRRQLRNTRAATAPVAGTAKHSLRDPRLIRS